jgi:two-component system, OmpR family, sensor kinase
MRPGRPGRPQLRTRVLAGVLGVTLIALVVFDFSAVTALRGYLLSRTDSQLRNVLNLYRPVTVRQAAVQKEQVQAVPPAGSTAVHVYSPRKLPQRWMISGPRVRLAPPILGQYYVAFVSVRGPHGFVVGNPGLVPQLPPWLPGPALAAGSHVAAAAGSEGPAQVAANLSWVRARNVSAVAGTIDQTVTSLHGSAQLRLRAVRVPAPAGTLVVTTSLAAVNKTVGRLELILTVGSLAAALLVALGVGWVMRRGLRPIETMAAHADRITAGDLTDRVGPRDTRTEVGRLGAALNGMLTRIHASVSEREASQEATRRFFADASHELRNPLASLRANAELYQQGALRHRGQVDEAMRRIAAEAQRMSVLVDDMLRLARLDQHPGEQHDPVDLTALVTECALRAQITDPQRTWHTDIAADLVTIGDEELLRRAIDNLLANVHAHTPAGTAATITSASHDGTVTVDVSDDGPGVPADRLPHIFDRFYRAGTQPHHAGAQPHHAGSGLGLAIVTAIAASHHGTTEAITNDPHGLRVTLTLPASDRLCPTAPAAASPASGLHASPAPL